MAQEDLHLVALDVNNGVTWSNQSNAYVEDDAYAETGNNEFTAVGEYCGGNYANSQGTPTVLDLFQVRFFDINSDHSNDTFLLQIYNPDTTSWETLETFNSGNLFPTSLTTKTYTSAMQSKFNAASDKSAFLDGLQLRVYMSVKSAGADKPEIGLAWSKCQYTYTAGAAIYYETVTATAVGSPVVGRELTLDRDVAATAVGTPVVGRELALERDVAATATGVPVVVAVAKHFNTAEVTANAIPLVTAVKKAKQTADATAVGVPLVITRLIENLVPDGDKNNEAWLDELDGDVDIYQSIDEGFGSLSDADYIHDDGTDAAYEADFSDVASSDVGRIVSIEFIMRARKGTTGGKKRQIVNAHLFVAGGVVYNLTWSDEELDSGWVTKTTGHVTGPSQYWTVEELNSAYMIIESFTGAPGDSREVQVSCAEVRFVYERTKFLKETVDAVAVGVPKVTLKVFHSAGDQARGQARVTKKFIPGNDIAATAIGVPVVVAVKKRSVAVDATAVGVPSVDRELALGRDVAAIALGAPVVVRKVTQTIAATATGVPVVVAVKKRSVAVDAVAVGVPVVVEELLKYSPVISTAIGVPVVSRKLLLGRDVTATSVGVPSASKKLTLGALDADATAIGVPVVVAVKKRSVPADATAIGVPVVVEVLKAKRTVIATAVGVPSASKKLTLGALDVDATAIGVPVVVAVKKAKQAADATAIGVPVVVAVKKRSVAADATATGVPVVVAVKKAKHTVTATAIGIPTVIELAEVGVDANAVAIGVPVVGRELALGRTAGATAIGVPVVVAVKKAKHTADATAIGVPVVVAVKKAKHTADATAIGVPSVSRKLFLGRAAAATAIGVPVVTEESSLVNYETVDAVAVGVPNVKIKVKLRVVATAVGVPEVDEFWYTDQNANAVAVGIANIERRVFRADYLSPDTAQVDSVVRTLITLIRNAMFPDPEYDDEYRRAHVVVNYDPFLNRSELSSQIVLNGLTLSRNMFYRQIGYEDPVKDLVLNEYTLRKNPVFMDLTFNLMVVANKARDVSVRHQDLMGFIKANPYIVVGDGEEDYEYSLVFEDGIGGITYPRNTDRLHVLNLRGTVEAVRVYPGIDLYGKLVTNRIFNIRTIDGASLLEEVKPEG